MVWCGCGRAASFRKQVERVVAVAVVVVGPRLYSFGVPVVRVRGERFASEFRCFLLVEQRRLFEYEGRLVD